MAAATNKNSRLHGPDHWERVARNAASIAAETPGANALVGQLFALLHDAMRTNDGHDPEHGPRAAALTRQLSPLLRIDDDALALLTQACERHDRGLVSDDPTIGCCWDADRLDLPRVGTIPDPRYFSTAAARHILTTPGGAT
jgi:uncharacterized protein